MGGLVYLLSLAYLPLLPPSMAVRGDTALIWGAVALMLLPLPWTLADDGTRTVSGLPQAMIWAGLWWLWFQSISWVPRDPSRLPTWPMRSEKSRGMFSMLFGIW